MSDTRRQIYYKRCQEIIDDLHARVAQGQFMSEQHCIMTYGMADYKALLHELRLMNALQDWTTMTPAMEWLSLSQYFKHKAEEEKASRKYRQSVFWSAVAAAVSAGCSFALCCKGCYDSKHANAHEAQASYNEHEIENSVSKVGEVGPTDEVLNVIPQIQDILNHQNRHAKDSAAKKGRKDESQ